MTYLNIKNRTKQDIVTIKICVFQTRADISCNILLLQCTPIRQQVCRCLNLNVEKLNYEQINEIYRQNGKTQNINKTYYVRNNHNLFKFITFVVTEI